MLTGLHATVAILAALRHRDVTGAGQHVEVSLLSALLSSLVNQSSAFVGAGVVPQRMGNAHPSIAPYDLFATADRPMIIAVGNDGQFRRLVEVLGRAELADHADYRTNTDRVSHRDALKGTLEATLTTRGADDWQRDLTAAGVPCGPINSIEQAFRLATRLGLEPVSDIDGIPVVANPVVYTATPADYRTPPPTVDSDRDEVLALLRERP